MIFDFASTFCPRDGVNGVMGRALLSFDDFLAGHVDEFLRLGHAICWDDFAAEDLVQDCLLVLAKRWPRVQVMQNPAAYARRVLVNLALDQSRARTRRRQELRADRDEPVESVLDDRPDLEAERALEVFGEREVLVSALRQLSAQQRTVLALRYFMDLTEPQVADLLGCSVGTVKKSSSRGLARLRELVPGPVRPKVYDP